MSIEKAALCGLTVEEIYDLIRPSGFTMAHATHIANSIYKKNISDLSLIPNISNKLKLELNNKAVSGIYLPVKSEVSTDLSVKYLFRSADGKEYETVYIPEKKRHTVCVSTQSGCRMGCSICATAKYGFRGNLTEGEIVNQIISLPEACKITHVVFMGMGEPMDNLENVLKACKIITAEYGLAISSRNVTVSSVGILPAIEEFLQVSNCNLTLSLLSPFSDERREFIPAEKAYPILKTIERVKNFPLKKKRTLSLAYIMIEGFNDSDQHLEELKTILSDSPVRVNLLPYHNIPGDPRRSSKYERMVFFKHNLLISGISASIRKSRGLDISAACGLLASGLT
jgi:23S rRNA (adenine2503-C2)-methyltransferase